MRPVFLALLLIATFSIANQSYAQKNEAFPLRDFTQCSTQDKSNAYEKPCKDQLASADIAIAIKLAENKDFIIDVQGDTLLVAAKVASDTLTFGGKPYLCCDIQAYLDPVADGIYAAKFRWHDMHKSLLEFRLINTTRRAAASTIYNGSKDFPDPRNSIDNAVLHNAGMQLAELAIPMNEEFGARDVTVIKGSSCLSSLSPCIVIYMADGESLAFMVKSALLEQRDLSRFIFVGIHNAKIQDHAVRIDELLYGYNQPRYDAFLEFVTATLIPHIEMKEIPLARYSAGYSNGGAWALDMLLTKPDIFTGAIVMSPAEWSSRTDTRLDERNVFIGAGHMELPFYAKARASAPLLRERGAMVQELYIPSGHSMNTWNNVWSRTLLALAPAPPLKD